MASQQQKQQQLRRWKEDPFLLNYNADDLRIASEFLSNWLPFLCHGLGRCCTQTLSDRIRSLDLETDGIGDLKQEENFGVLTLKNMEINGCGCDESQDYCDTDSFGSWKDGADVNDSADTNSSGPRKDGTDGASEPVTGVETKASTSETLGADGSSEAVTGVETKTSTSETLGSQSAPFEIPGAKMSWADMAQEDELESVEETEVISRQVANRNGIAEEGVTVKEVKPRSQLSWEQRDYIRFSNVIRKKDFICLERVKGKIVNILDGLELHAGVFSCEEQRRIVAYVEVLREMGRKGELKERTFTAPQKWMRGKGRVTIQFGCCYNYAMDKNGNPPGILKNEVVDPIPDLFKVMIRRLIRWHVLPPSCIPDSCIVNIYDKGDCTPPYIENHDFVRPFCTVSFLSDCNILFGSDLKIVGPGKFSGHIAVPLPVGSVLVFNGNGANIAKHCVPAVPTKRISITFRKMDESKWPIGYVPEPGLQGLQPLSYGVNMSRNLNSPKPRRFGKEQVVRREEREENINEAKGSIERGSDLHHSNRTRQGSVDRRKAKLYLGN